MHDENEVTAPCSSKDFFLNKEGKRRKKDRDASLLLPRLPLLIFHLLVMTMQRKWNFSFINWGVNWWISMWADITSNVCPWLVLFDSIDCITTECKTKVSSSSTKCSWSMYNVHDWQLAYSPFRVSCSALMMSIRELSRVFMLKLSNDLVRSYREERKKEKHRNFICSLLLYAWFKVMYFNHTTSISCGSIQWSLVALLKVAKEHAHTKRGEYLQFYSPETLHTLPEHLWPR